MAWITTCLLLVVLSTMTSVSATDAGTQVLQHIVDRLVHRYEEDDHRRRVCGTEIISTPDHMLFRNGSRVPSFDVEAPVCCQGYERNATSLKCVPKCPSGCPNGRCVAPDLCACLPQFARSLDWKCVPTCPTSCLNGRCYGDRCVCNPGFKYQKRICVPQCHGNCAGGNCTAPNTCNCTKAGYVPNEQGNCKPFCQGGCVNAKCTSPNRCTCLERFKKQTGIGAKPNVCVPECFEKCEHGYCTDTGKCSCYPGYTASKRKFVCEPLCQPGCVNATCNNPGVCTCKPGYTKLNNDGGSHICTPVNGGRGGACGNCTNGMCSSGRCLCYEGYYKDHTTSLCLPHCSMGCEHGFCSAPSKCTCDPGYAFDFFKKACLLSCNPPCQNGACVDGNTCSCNPGYARDSTDWTGRRCLPLCNPFCVNGICSSPNKCTCKPGFVKDTSSGYDHICVPSYGRNNNNNYMTTPSYG